MVLEAFLTFLFGVTNAGYVMSIHRGEGIAGPGAYLGRAAGTGNMQNISKFAYVKMTLYAQL